MARGYLIIYLLWQTPKYNKFRPIIYLYLVLAFLINDFDYLGWSFFCKFCCALFLPDIFPAPTLITISANKLLLTDIDSGRTIWELSAKTDVKDICYTANDDKAYHVTEASLFILNIQNASMFQVFLYSLPYLRESRKVRGHYCHYFMANCVFLKSKNDQSMPLLKLSY